MGQLSSAKKKKKNAPKAVSIWADAQTRALYKRISKRAHKPLSEIVRTMARRYDATGKFPGLPSLTPKKKKARAPVDLQPVVIA